MNKLLLGIFGLVIGLGIIGLVSAHGFDQSNTQSGEQIRAPVGTPGLYHEEMEQILKEGTFEDLAAFRAEKGFGGPRWVTDETTFEQWKAQHALMEEQGMTPGYERMHQGQGKGRRMMQEHCPLIQ